MRQRPNGFETKVGGEEVIKFGALPGRLGALGIQQPGVVVLHRLRQQWPHTFFQQRHHSAEDRIFALVASEKFEGGLATSCLANQCVSTGLATFDLAEFQVSPRDQRDRLFDFFNRSEIRKFADAEIKERAKSDIAVTPDHQNMKQIVTGVGRLGRALVVVLAKYGFQVRLIATVNLNLHGDVTASGHFGDARKSVDVAFVIVAVDGQRTGFHPPVEAQNEHSPTVDACVFQHVEKLRDFGEGSRGRGCLRHDGEPRTDAQAGLDAAEHLTPGTAAPDCVVAGEAVDAEAHAIDVLNVVDGAKMLVGDQRAVGHEGGPNAMRVAQNIDEILAREGLTTGVQDFADFGCPSHIEQAADLHAGDVSSCWRRNNSGIRDCSLP